MRDKIELVRDKRQAEGREDSDPGPLDIFRVPDKT